MRGDQRPFLLGDKQLNTSLAEAYRKLRWALLARNGESPVRTILVTSARAGEGKTTTVANLGIIVGSAGGRTLLVDADFRHPALDGLLTAGAASSRRVGPPAPSARMGLADVLRNEVPLEEVIVPTSFEGVSLLPAGSNLSKPGDLLGSPRMPELLHSLRKYADLVLIDSPPCLDYVDAIELASRADAVLYVVRAGDQDPAAQRQVEAQLVRAKAHMLGVVFNGA